MALRKELSNFDAGLEKCQHQLLLEGKGKKKAAAWPCVYVLTAAFAVTFNSEYLTSRLEERLKSTCIAQVAIKGHSPLRK